MVSDVNPKRQWTMAIVATVVVVGVVGFVVLRENPKDVPRLNILRQAQVNGQNAVIFRLDAPKHKAMEFGNVTTRKPSAETGREAVCDGPPGNYVEAGKSMMFSVISPLDAVWRVRCEVNLEDRGMKDAVKRLKLCWRAKSFGPLLWRDHRFFTLGVVESDAITNAVPPATHTTAG